MQHTSPKKISGPMMYPEAVQQPSETSDVITFSAQPPRIPVRQLSRQAEDIPKSPDIRQEVLTKSRSSSVLVKPAKPDPSAFVEQTSKPRPIPPPKPGYLSEVTKPFVCESDTVDTTNGVNYPRIGTESRTNS